MRSLVLTMGALVVLSCGPAGDAGRTAASGGSGDASTSTTATVGTVFDSTLARELGADAYGMKGYVMALLEAGPNHDMDSTRAAELLKAHLANIQRLARDGKLILAGPFSDTTELAGIYVFNVATLEEARALTETDPAIRAGRFVMELHPWYGPAMLQRVAELNRKVERQSF